MNSKLLLCCDEYIYKYGNAFYFKNQEWYDFFHRYLRIFDCIRLIARCKQEANLNPNRVPVDIERVDFLSLPFFQGPKQYASRYFEIGKILANAADDCSCAILRLPFVISERLGRILVKNKIPYALEIVYDAEDSWKNATSLIEKILWMRIDNNMRYLSKYANGISCVTEKYLQRHYHSEVKDAFISNYSSLALDKSFYTTRRNYPEDKIMTIANVANQVEYNGRKGHAEIIKAISALRNEGVTVNAKFAGEDYNNGIALLSALASDLGVSTQIEFLGYLQRKDLSTFLEEADLYVMPTKAEGLPRVIIEAMAKGLPCITTNVSGNSELVQSQYLIDDYYDISSWASKIKEFVTDKTKYEGASMTNYNNSLKYEASILQVRRDIFYSKLKEISR